MYLNLLESPAPPVFFSRFIGLIEVGLVSLRMQSTVSGNHGVPISGAISITPITSCMYDIEPMV
jgi:hypothetical protein